MEAIVIAKLSLVLGFIGLSISIIVFIEIFFGDNDETKRI